MFKRKPSDKKKAGKKAKPAKAPKAKKEKAPKAKKAKRPTADVVIQKPDTDVYTVMLVISFIAVLIGCILLYLELSRYGSYPWWNTA